MAQTCPWCREPLAGGARDDTACPRCRRPLRDDAGRELRPIDLRWKRVEEGQWSRLRAVLVVGTPLVALLALLTPPVASPVVAAVLAATHLVVLRLAIVRPVDQLVGARRRMLDRWVSRLLVVWIALPAYAATVVPIGGAVVAAAAFVLVTVAVHACLLRSLYRERDRMPQPTWALAAVVAAGVVTLAAIVVLLALVAAVGWSVGGLLGELLGELP